MTTDAQTTLTAAAALLGVGDPGCATGRPLSDTTTVTVDGDGSGVDANNSVGLIVGHSNGVKLGDELVARSSYPWVNASAWGKDSRAWSVTPSLWDDAETALTAANWTNDDVEVVWSVLSRAVGVGEWGDWDLIYRYLDDMEQVLGEVKNRFPNVKLCYLGSRFTGRHAVANNGEPSAYRHGLVNVLLAANHEAPFDVVVGPYLWDDGDCVRGDGFVVEAADLDVNGAHPNPVGLVKFGDAIHDYFSTHPSAVDWYTD